ncbi:F0F1 ATP synthase subunit epsilon [Fodinibius halophilus]|uniref:ATP synthase epsilon chain n=1 Tax=Fodinibius halophilus TaxID=1736908 RepID=A0A6M1T356_9BACT|nr:F0F1 ATP synthase subunit epsilon [Fodinibius halophilus]NGP89866.1 F0F1 ATP synthase subunit epsilon [Fodinibius halophilus]
MKNQQMHLKIMVPERIITEVDADKIIAEAYNGFFCLKPKHIDFTAALKRGILYYYSNNDEQIIAIDKGILVKCGANVSVSVLNAIRGENLNEIEQQVQVEFSKAQDLEEASVQALKNLEAELVQHFVDLQKKESIL